LIDELNPDCKDLYDQLIRSAMTSRCFDAHSPSLRANGSRERAPDDRLREAVQKATQKELNYFVAKSLRLLPPYALWRQEGAIAFDHGRAAAD
jgi:hypothetical protein